MKKKEPEKFKFKRHASIGAAAAEDDDKFLASCFINTGDLDVLLDTTAPPRIILGRTGTGKTALLNQLTQEAAKVISIEPQNLSFNYLTNSNILQFLIGAGINLDLFFKLLWRHVFVVELIKAKYHINSEEEQLNFFSRLTSILSRDKKKQRAIDYLKEFGDQFWEDTEYRVKEITNKFEEKLSGQIGANVEAISFGAEGATILSTEEKAEINKRTLMVTNDIQLKELAHVFEYLNDDVFNDENQPYYICVDRLDENWIADKFRYLLIRSLIDCVREFNKVKNIKIILALRTDLIERVVRLTRDGGFQEEKYRSLYLPLKWDKIHLKDLLDTRVNYLLQSSYGGRVTASRVLPTKINKIQAIDYMLDRTLMRPRELIEFFNLCLEQAAGRPSITREVLVKAESIYSKNRLRSLQDEWVSDFPKLIEFTEIIKKTPKQFKIKNIDQGKVIEICLAYKLRNPNLKDYLSDEAQNVVDSTKHTSSAVIDFLKALFQVFYRTGLVGIKVESFETIQWSFSDATSISASTIDEETSVKIHPTFWRVLGTMP